MDDSLSDHIAVMIEERHSRPPGESQAARLKAEAAAELAGVITVMQEAGLLDAGFRVGRKKDLPGIDWGGRPGSVVRERLILARNHVRDRIRLITAPDAVIEYQRTFISVLGDPEVGVCWHAGWDLR